jgi:predicted Fe-Mo cluster-binding NifX family protein
MAKSISLISDCKVVLCARIGGAAEDELRKRGIKPVEAPYLINEALLKYGRWI